jgi:hypothetical protein
MGEFIILESLIIYRSNISYFHSFLYNFSVFRYTLRKRLEHAIKGLFYGFEKISCVPSKLYASRLVNFFEKASV